MEKPWEFWIDAGGTFTDCVARRPDGQVVTHKVLSTGRSHTTCGGGGENAAQWRDPALSAAPPGFYDGWELSCRLPEGREAIRRTVRRFDRERGVLELAEALPKMPTAGWRGELASGEEAPVVAIRWLLGRKLGEPIGRIRVRIGTTKATNALLERRGARTALVITAGFSDMLRIGYQDRPALFDLKIDQPPELYEAVLPVVERLDANGNVLTGPDEASVRAGLAQLRDRGIKSLAVCLLHAYLNGRHEELIHRWASETGFQFISLSSRVSPLPKFIYRGDTTVLDAYLTPLLREYCELLEAQLPEADIRYMTSSGSLVAAGNFSGKDAILSGPAGGVVGTARITDRAGLAPAFAFDMGGTSTDVSRWDGRAFNRRYEMEVGGGGAGGARVRRLRLQSSMLEIETVAAGGGSICWFDGQKTMVGPRSAGADPGPACYGRGGPLTVTDINLYLGRVPRFPFPLDLAAVEARLDELIREVRAASGRDYSRLELASGFLRIANANMVAPIKKLAASRGDDVRAHTLVAFGGAGGQHACAIARELGMTRVLCSPYAGVLSALGIGLAPITRFAERALPPSELPPASRQEELEWVFETLEEELRARLAAEGVRFERLGAPSRRLEMRYRGQEARLIVPPPPDGDYAAAFTKEHQRAFQFTIPDRLVECYAARVELGTLREEIPGYQEGCASSEPAPGTFFADVYFGEGAAWQRTAVHERAALVEGATITGPAIVLEGTATVVIDPGWSARVSAHGDLILEDQATDSPAASPKTSRNAEKVDPVELELFHNRLSSFAEQMGAVLQRTALSTNVKERLDFSCALFDDDGLLLANAAHIPVHLGAMQECVRCLREDAGAMRPGDVFVTNDPFRGGSHLPDVTVITPIFVGESGVRPSFFAASRAHHAEVGGIAPGSLPPGATCLADEGVLLRCLRLRPDEGEVGFEILRAALLVGPHPTRSVEENLADIRAQIAANQAGGDLLAELVVSEQLSFVRAYCGHLRAASEQKMRRALAKLAPGVRSAQDALDDGTPIRVTISTAADGSATFNFAGSGPVHPGNLNANRAIVASAVIYCLRSLLGEPIPLNAGLLAPVVILVPGVSVLDPPGHADPRRCPAVGGGSVETSQRIVDVILRALGIAADSQGTMNNLLFGREAGAPEGNAFGYYETMGGGSGGGRSFAGASAVHTHMTNTRLTDPEVLETRYPVRLRECSIRRGSGGGGLSPGGDGMVREIEFLAPLKVSLLTSRRTRPPSGCEGGQDGAPGRNLLRREGEKEFRDLPSSAQVLVKPGDVLRVETPGGGGWGESTS